MREEAPGQEDETREAGAVKQGNHGKGSPVSDNKNPFSPCADNIVVAFTTKFLLAFCEYAGPVIP